MTGLLELIITLLLLIGASIALLGSWGLARLPDFFMRLHGPTKASTLGVGATLLGSLIYFSSQQPGISVQEALITLFLFVTAPVSAHMLAKVALHRKLPLNPKTRNSFTKDE
ncbi:multisubunit potassium/proton antiporter, PhaG subunit [Marinospirillum celere]|uniref:Multisubunit potassium/proton antiporter, PhaG subunit n=1 Tax=Marinospirillum celere TaxID=1122252 RepID=A0A1I1GQH2_9GAMM|nr:Na+/H+ antiporter subunit G [Marinospirillum celere]SFC13751.1 multisubunit potassium/proton antiporter, PhaG subunit [Marinospirillum celere]